MHSKAFFGPVAELELSEGTTKKQRRPLSVAGPTYTNAEPSI